jgi:hypothetical protein
MFWPSWARQGSEPLDEPLHPLNFTPNDPTEFNDKVRLTLATR